jgi:methylenetetrahydrofolate reductase (NADPH)
MKAVTNLQKILAQGAFAVTCAYDPPRGIALDSVTQNAAQLKEKVDAVQLSDNATATVTMSSLALSKILLDAGLEPILQMATRDRNRIALQSDVLGASALGIQNILCLNGDHPSKGDQPETKRVYDLDAIQWIAAVKDLRDHGSLMNGKQISGDPGFLIGTSANPFVKSLELHVMRLEKKIAAGADFIQTEPVLDLERFNEWLQLCAEKGLPDQCPIVAGVIAIKSAAVAEYLRDNVPGIMVPGWVISELGNVPEDQQLDEGIRMCVEQIEALKETKGVSGVHIIATGCEERIPEIIERAKLLPRPSLA